MTMSRPYLFPWWAYWLSLAVICVFAFSPLVGTVLSNGLAFLTGCWPSDGASSGCGLVGIEWTSLLYALSLTSWFTLITFPIAAGALSVWLIVIITHRIAWRQMPKAF